jgi:hypothetical protein
VSWFVIPKKFPRVSLNAKANFGHSDSSSVGDIEFTEAMRAFAGGKTKQAQPRAAAAATIGTASARRVVRRHLPGLTASAALLFTVGPYIFSNLFLASNAAST